ncbi:MAG: hypothetical protein JWN33_415 [Candidatus Saccharibacteria bacterium]|nr:hypothetical protein [Candidatus Saccharibacteria bacterium]
MRTGARFWQHSSSLVIAVTWYVDDDERSGRETAEIEALVADGDRDIPRDTRSLRQALKHRRKDAECFSMYAGRLNL